MFHRFTESFEWRLQQRDSEVLRECSRSPLCRPSPGKSRFTEFSQEDSRPDMAVRVASVVRALSPGMAHTDRHIVLAEHGDTTLTVHLGATEEASAF